MTARYEPHTATLAGARPAVTNASLRARLDAPGWPANVPRALRMYYIQIVSSANTLLKQSNMLKWWLACCRYFLPAASLTALYHIIQGPSTIPQWLTYGLLCIGIASLSYSFSLDARISSLKPPLYELWLKVQDADLVIDHFNAEFEFQNYLETRGKQPDLHAYPAALDQCPSLHIPAGSEYNFEDVQIPPLHELCYRDGSLLLLQDILQAAISMSFAVVLTLFAFEFFRHEEHPRTYFAVILILITLLQLAVKSTAKHNVLKSELKPEYSYLADPDMHRSGS